MRNPNAFRNAAFFAAGGFAAALFLGGAAQAITDTVFKYSTPRTGHLVVMPAAFVARSLVYDYTLQNGYLAPATNNPTCFSAPVNLPQGAKMTALAVGYYLTSPDTITVTLARHSLIDGSLADIAIKFPPATGGAYNLSNVNITNASLQTVDNQRYGYYLDLCMQGGTFAAARLAYTYTNAGD